MEPSKIVLSTQVSRWHRGDMMILRKSNERGHADHGWLKTRYSFSFADYFDPAWMGFRSLRVINDDVVAPEGGFPMHGHRDMEILTYVLSGKLEHRDSMGNGRVIQAGDMQYMSAGAGVKHSEFNPSLTEPVHLLQIWIFPDRKGYPPRYADRSLADKTGLKGLQLIASRDGRSNSMEIRQDADVWLGWMKKGESAEHVFLPNRHGWLHLAKGAASVNQQSLESGDSLALSEVSSLAIKSESDETQVLLFDMV